MPFLWLWRLKSVMHHTLWGNWFTIHRRYASLQPYVSLSLSLSAGCPDILKIAVHHSCWITFGWPVWLWDLDGFQNWIRRDAFLSESQRDKKLNLRIFKWMSATYISIEGMHFASDVFSSAQHAKIICVKKKVVKLPTTMFQTKYCAVDWVCFQYLLFLSEFCDSGLTLWPPTKTPISQYSQSYIQCLYLFLSLSFSPDGSWNDSKLMNIITAS